MLAQIELAEKPLQQKNIDDAMKLFNQAISIDENYFEPYVHLSRLYIKQNKSSDAFKTLEKAQALLPKSADVLNALGEAHFAEKDYEKAQRFFEEAVAIRPNMNLALYNLANVLREQGKEVEALSAYEKLKTRDENYPGLAENLARLYFLKRDYVSAATSYEKVLATTTEPSLELQSEAAQAFFAASRAEQAYTLAENILRTEPMSHVGRAIKAEALYQQKQLTRAMVEIRVALDRKERSDYYRVLGLIHQAQGEQAEAIDAYENALKLDPNREDIRLMVVKLLVANARADDTLKHVKMLLQQNPTLSSAYFYRGKALAYLGREDQAIQAYEMAVTRNPSLAEAHFELGLLYNDRQKVSKAHEHFESAIKHAEEDAHWRPQAYFLLGETLMKLNRKAHAIEAFQTYLKIAPLSAGARDEAKRLLIRLEDSR